MTVSSPSKPKSRRGFRRLSYDDAFPLAVEHAAVVEELENSLTGPEQRQLLKERLRSLGNKLTPAFRQAASPLDSLLHQHATNWIAQNSGMPNINAFISDFQKLPGAVRSYQRGTAQPITADAIRKKLIKMRKMKLLDW